MKFFDKVKALFRSHEEKVNKLTADRKPDQSKEARSLDEEKRFYDRQYPEKPQDKVIRESGGQDVSAI